MSERYTETAVHFDVERLPSLLARSLPPGPLALVDLGCGDGPCVLRVLRAAKVPIPGYYGLELVVER